jgi:hypothetical protein
MLSHSVMVRRSHLLARCYLGTMCMCTTRESGEVGGPGACHPRRIGMCRQNPTMLFVILVVLFVAVPGRFPYALVDLCLHHAEKWA